MAQVWKGERSALSYKASARVMERLGLRRKAHFLENDLSRGEWMDELVYASR